MPAENLVPCPIQPDPTKYQREKCGLITDQSVDDMRDLLIDLTTSRKAGRVKLELDMPFYQSQKATAYLDMNTGDCAYYHQDSGNYWTYMKYDKDQIGSTIAKSDTVKYANTKDSNPEL